MDDVASMVSALSVMLGAYAFFYNAFSPRINAGEDVGGSAANRTAWERQVRTVERARTAARGLAVIPLIVFLVFLPEIVDRVGALADAAGDGDYETLDVVFLLLAVGWLAIAYLVFLQAHRLTGVLERLRGSEPQE
jgi:hypothetical protein